MAVELRYNEEHDQQSTKIGALVTGETTRTGVANALLANLPATYGPLVFQRIERATLIEGTTDIWDCEIRYGQYQEKQELQDGDSEFRFSSFKRSIKRTISISSRCYDSSGEIEPDDLQIIGWKPGEGRADGTDDTEYLNAFSWRVAVNATTASESWRREAGELRNSVNTSTFFSYPAESVLFDDITGGVTGNGIYTFELSFIQSPNLSEVEIGGITVGDVTGWEVIDVDDMAFTVIDVGSKKRRVPKVERVKIHQIKEIKDWSMLASLLGMS